MNEMLPSYKPVIEEIVDFDWAGLDQKQMTAVAWAYYYFSIQFRENLNAAIVLHPDEEQLQHLAAEECNTDNLSPWPGVAAPGEKMNHDDFMRRVLILTPIEPAMETSLKTIGERYLAATRLVDDQTKAM